MSLWKVCCIIGMWHYVELIWGKGKFLYLYFLTFFFWCLGSIKLNAKNHPLNIDLRAVMMVSTFCTAVTIWAKKKKISNWKKTNVEDCWPVIIILPLFRQQQPAQLVAGNKAYPCSQPLASVRVAAPGEGQQALGNAAPSTQLNLLGGARQVVVRSGWCCVDPLHTHFGWVQGLVQHGGRAGALLEEQELRASSWFRLWVGSFHSSPSESLKLDKSKATVGEASCISQRGATAVSLWSSVSSTKPRLGNEHRDVVKYDLWKADTLKNKKLEPRIKRVGWSYN